MSKCENCNKLLIKQQKKCCSRSCSNVANTKYILFVCMECKKEIIVSSGLSALKFCSRECFVKYAKKNNLLFYNKDLATRAGSLGGIQASIVNEKQGTGFCFDKKLQNKGIQTQINEGIGLFDIKRIPEFRRRALKTCIDNELGFFGKDFQKNQWLAPNFKTRVSNKISEVMTKKWEDLEYKEMRLRKYFKTLNKHRLTNIEQYISLLLVSYHLPFLYTGNGLFFIGGRCPDFVDKKGKIVIEVYYEFFKIKEFGSCDNYEEWKSKIYSKHGYKTIFIRGKMLDELDKDYMCLQKICEVLFA